MTDSPAPVATHHLVVPRTARFCTLGGEGPRIREIWLACHGYGQLAADFARGFAAVAAPERLIVAPEATSRFYLDGEVGPHGPGAPVGATWMTREDRLTDIDDYVAYLDRLHAHVSPEAGGRSEAPRTLALGFSQGVATAARWAARTAAPLAELVLWGSAPPPELEAAALAAVRPGLLLTLVAGTRDRWFRPEALEREAARLEGAGLRVRVLSFEGGHRLDDGVLRRLAEEARGGPARGASADRVVS